MTVPTINQGTFPLASATTGDPFSNIAGGNLAQNSQIMSYNPASVAITGGAIGGIPLRSYLGLVASRGGIPTGFSAPTKQSVSRSKHTAMESISSLQLVFANFYVTSSVETSPGAVTQYTASIEYPVGTITVARFSGSFTGVATNGGVLVSDAVSVAIPKGASFYVRVWSNCTAGAIFHSNYGLNNVTGAVPASGEWRAFGTTVTDYTQSTTNFNNQQSGSYFKPTAIIGYTERPTFFLAGDSRLGNGTTYDTVPNSYGGVGEVERSLVKTFGTLNAGCAGETVANAIGANFTKRLALAAYCSHIISEYGINDFGGGANLATTLANLATFATQFGGKPVFQTTLTPRTTSTDSWATTANQTTWSPGGETNRSGFNDAVRLGLAAPMCGCIEVADQVESARNSGLWKVTGSANGYTSDGIHGNSAANSLIEVSTAFQAVTPPG